MVNGNSWASCPEKISTAWRSHEIGRPRGPTLSRGNTRYISALISRTTRKLILGSNSLRSLIVWTGESETMSDVSDYWRRRQRLIQECHRCDQSNRFLLLATPLYIFFPIFLLFVIPLFIMFKRIRYLAIQQLKKDQEKFCTLISGQNGAKPAIPSLTDL